MPPKFKVLLQAFKDYFFYCEDGVIVIPEEDLIKRRKLSYDDIRLGCIYLKDKDVLQAYRSAKVIGRIPVDPKKKLALVNARFDWGQVFEGLSRDVFVFSFTSKEDFLKFCDSFSLKTEEPTRVVGHDLLIPCR